MIKIYQLHEYSGQYEDFRDHIIGSYLRKNRADDEKLKAELIERDLKELSRKCDNCPFLNNEPEIKLEDLIGVHSDYCDMKDLDEGEYGISCENRYYHWDEASFEVVEIDVEE